MVKESMVITLNIEEEGGSTATLFTGTGEGDEDDIIEDGVIDTHPVTMVKCLCCHEML